ncbi:pre-toxin TG domain-containing protein [Desulfohalobium retbaense]|uniref:pre-toxin TG domain-containing protein n=1 Tax=Desulfohalobium retbaense TaxID=45663 RepID=UPI0011D111E7|nr:pre-toxin TG domain-containing protein [Desulfohalobium retbaense]
MHKESAKLLQRLQQLRRQELDAMRREILDKVQDWDSGLVTLDGASLQTTLRRAKRLAAANGLDVQRLETLYAATQRIIKRFEFVSLCGSEQAVPDTTGNGASDASGAEQVLKWFDFADREEQRLACAQEKRVMLYTNTARAFVRALAAPDPAAAAAGFREYAEAVRTINDAEALAITAQCEQLAAEQELVARTAELVPLVGEAMDILAATQGRDLNGQELTTWDRLLRGIMLLTPEVVGQVGRRYPEALPHLMKGLQSLAAPEGGAVQRAIARTGQAAETVAGQAASLLAALRGSKAAGAATQVAKRTTDATAKVSQAVAAIKHLPFYAAAKTSEAATQHLPRQWAKALSTTAANRKEILLIRPVNKHAKPWLEKGLAVGKGMHVKAKTASQGPLAGLIPVDQRLSKLSDPAYREELVGAYRSELREQAQAAGREVSAAALERQAQEKAREQVTREMQKAQQAAAEARGQGYATAVPLVIEDKQVVRALDQSGKGHTVLKTTEGRYLDPQTGAPVELALDPGSEVPVEVLAEPGAGGKYFTADADLLGVGTSSQTSGVAARTSQTGSGPALDPDTDTAVWGTATETEVRTAFEVNVQGRLGGEGERILQHGPAVRFPEKPDFPITMFLPDASVVEINNQRQLREVLVAAKRQGVQGLEPHPAWGWGANWWRDGQ